MNASWAIFLLCLISRQVEANIRRSTEYRRYNLLLPEFLHNRPYLFTKHCVGKIELAKAIGENRIKRINDNNFTVTSLQENGKRYKVVLTNNNGFPSCECADWKNNMSPCKHMFAIFGKIDGLDWNSFSVNYRNSPYFCLDINNQILDKSNEEFPVCENEAPEPVCKNDDQNAYFKTLPKKQHVKRSKVSMRRELLTQTNSLIFLVLEEETLEKLGEDLRDIVEDLKLKAPHDAGLIKESFSYVRSSPKQGIYRDPLPKHKIKTLHYPEELELEQRRDEQHLH